MIKEYKVNGYTIKPGADLIGADLRGANLWKADLRKANLWKADLRDADLRGADLRGADIREADLRGADLDFSCWPLWCGSPQVEIDERLAKQLMYHALAVSQKHLPRKVPKWMLHWVNTFHRVGEVPEL